MDAKLDVKTAGRTLDVFEAFEALKRPVTLSELALHIEAPMSSCHGLVTTLRNRGYLYSPSRRELYPTKRLFDVASAISARDPILERLGPALAALRDETAETVILGKRQDDRIVYLDVVEGPQTIRYVARPGKMTPLHSSAIGKAMLGEMTERELETFVQAPLPRITDRTLTDAGVLCADIKAGRERGYFATRGENVADVMGVARTIHVGAGSLGIAIAGPLPRMEANLESCVAKLRAACAAIEQVGEWS